MDGDRVITDVPVGVLDGASVVVDVSVGVNELVGVPVGVSVAAACCTGFFPGAARTLLLITIPKIPPARSTVDKTRKKNLLSRNMTGMFTSRQ
jgi:hypothetical protein